VVDASISALQEQLAAVVRREPAEQRKLVTVLFVDIVDSTIMVQTLDVEDSLRLIDTAMGRLAAPVEAHGGRVMRYLGDGFMAAFGLPRSRENDAETAVRAALAILDTAREYAASLEGSRLTAPFQVRVGVDTGWVATGGQTEAEGTMAGAVINLAARIEKAAPPGSLWISHHTYQQVRGIFDMEAVDPVTVKGFIEPVPVYRVSRAKVRSLQTRGRGVEGVESPMVGREREMAALRKSYWTAIRDGKHHFVTVLGEAGLGKSRLMYEFENWVDLQPAYVRLFRGRARTESQNLAYGLLRDIFAFRLNIQEDEPAPVVARKLESGFAEALADDPRSAMKAHFVGHLAGYDMRHSPQLAQVLAEPQQVRDRALLYLTEYIQGLAEIEPVVILLEDLHWADDGSLDMLERLSVGLVDRPVLIVANARSDMLERRPDFAVGQSHQRRLHVRPLSKAESRTLVDRLLRHVERVPAALRELVVGNAEGVPFYVEELVKMLIEDGVIVKDEPHWRVQAERLVEARVPNTLAKVIQTRIDSLSEPERHVLQQASVVGRVFWDSVLFDLSQQGPLRLPDEEVSRVLTDLQAKELVFVRADTAFAGSKEYIFKHAILQQVAYEGVLRRARRAYHLQVAQWLERQGGQRAGEFAGLVADHLERAERPEEALMYLERAADEATARFANQAAIDYYTRALRLTPAGDLNRRFQLLLARECVYDRQGLREAQTADLQRLEELAGQLSRERAQAEVALRRANFSQLTSDYEAALEAAAQAIEWSRRAGDLPREVSGLLAEGKAYWRLGTFDLATDRLMRVLELAQQAQLDSMVTDSLRTLGSVAFTRGDLEAARAYNSRALQAAGEIGSLPARANSLINLGAIAALQFNYKGARDYFEEALALAREMGERRVEAMAFNNLGMTAGQAGDYELALAHYRQGLQVAREISNRHGEGNTLNNLSWLSGLTGSYEEAIAYGLQGLQVAREIGNQASESEALMALGHAQLGLGDPEAAAEAYRRSLALREQAGRESLTLEPVAGLARAALAAGDIAGALEHVEALLAYLDAGGDVAGADEPLRVYLTCYHVLRACNDHRAEPILGQAHERLTKMAARLPDEAGRQLLLNNVPWHREILELWNARNSARVN
jgi:class 3 adenylate cyclase/tetratricopeptide (TPR) repeat protein